jgi:hypothetical protein
MSNPKKLEWCNWSFDECIKPSQRWLVKRDCDDTSITLSRNGGKNWNAYKKSLEPQIQTRYQQPKVGAECPKCRKQVNGVNPYDDGETWRK